MSILTKRLSWRTKQEQFYQSFGCGQTHTIKFMGKCECCGRSVYSHGCNGVNPCGDVVEDSPDARGIIPARHCMNLYHAKEYGMVGRDVVTCAECADDGDKYRGIIAAAKSTGTWKAATVFEEVKASNGYISNHESDLYIEVTEQNRDILHRHNLLHIATKFRNQVTGKTCYDVPFAFDPFWAAKGGK